MLKTFGYYLFAFVYFLCKLFPIKKNRVLCIMTHDDGEGSNVSLIANALKAQDSGYFITYITKRDTIAVKRLSDWRKAYTFFFQKPYQMARAEIILLDNIFLPFAYLHRKKKAKVIQLWHGTGTIKKFGQDVNNGKLKKLEKRANANITHLIVNSPEMRKLYAGAFGIAEECIYPIGLPKTDEILNRILKVKETKINIDKEFIYQKYEIPEENKLILYAPTFRDQEIDNPKVSMQLEDLLLELPTGYDIGLRLHPYVAKAFSKQQLDPRLHQLSFEEDLNTVLMASDLLITDYSSIIFEYCLTEHPMIFYAYDFDEFSSRGRGFYYNYVSYVPGPIAFTGKEVTDLIKENQFSQRLVREFKEQNFLYLDGSAIERLIDLIKN